MENNQEYTITVQTKDREFVHEHERIENIDKILAQYPDYIGVRATRNDAPKKLVKRRGCGNGN